MTVDALQAEVESWMERTFADALFLTFANSVAGKLMDGVLGVDGRTWISPPLRVRAMEASDTLSVAAGVAALPADWLEFRRVWVADNPDGKDLAYLPKQQFATAAPTQETGWPARFYTLDGGNLLTAPVGDGDVEASYYAKLGDFAADGDTDAILSAYPHVYRAGCIAEACGWVGDYEREDRENARFAALVRGLNASDRRAQASGSVLVMRPGNVA